MIEFLCVVFFMYIWFETDFMVDYGRVLGLSKWMNISNWEEWREKRPKTGYLEYLSVRHRNFFTKLISCKSCLCFWLSLITSYFGVGIIWTPVIYLSSLLVYNIYVWLLWKLRRY